MTVFPEPSGSSSRETKRVSRGHDPKPCFNDAASASRPTSRLGCWSKSGVNRLSGETVDRGWRKQPSSTTTDRRRAADFNAGAAVGAPPGRCHRVLDGDACKNRRVCWPRRTTTR